MIYAKVRTSHDGLRPGEFICMVKSIGEVPWEKERNNDYTKIIKKLFRLQEHLKDEKLLKFDLNPKARDWEHLFKKKMIKRLQ